MNTYELVKSKAGRNPVVVSVFVGEDIDDPIMLNEVKTYLTKWFDNYTSGEIDLSDFDKMKVFEYDGWYFKLRLSVGDYVLERINKYNWEKLAEEVLDNRHMDCYVVIDIDGEIWPYWEAHGGSYSKRRNGKTLAHFKAPSYQYIEDPDLEDDEVYCLAGSLHESALSLLNEIDEGYFELD